MFCIGYPGMRESQIITHLGKELTWPRLDEDGDVEITHVTFDDGDGIHVVNVICGRQHMFYQNEFDRYLFFTEGCHVFMILSPIYNCERGIVGIDFDEDELAGPYNIPKREVCGDSLQPMVMIPDDVIACHNSAVEYLFDEKCKKCPKESWDRYETCEHYDGYLEWVKRRRENTEE